MASVGLRNHLFHRPEECDSFQPCFFEHETDVEFYGTRAPMPSDEIWDKFELLPTPPRSPNREPITEDYQCSMLDTEAERLHLQPLVGLGEDVLPLTLPKTLPFPESPPLNSKLIQDCMWSGRNLLIPDICADKMKLEKSQTSCQQHGSVVSKLSSTCVGNVGVDVNLPTECVDPAAVFPYPINGTREYLGTDTPSDSEDEEGDEEIDVVNVEKMQSAHVPTRHKISPPVSPVQHHKRTKSSPEEQQTLTIAQQQTARLLLQAVHNCHTYSKQIPAGQQQSRSGTTSPVQGHSTNLKRTCKSVSLPSSPQPLPHTPAKRTRRQLTVPELKKVCQKLKNCGSSRNSSYSSCSPTSSSCSSRFGSDSEDCESTGGKRTQHNVLERKRRNDLKYSFFSLRDSVPELNKQERAPKVVILRKATDYILDLTDRHNRINKELEKQKTRNEQLKKALQILS